MKTRSAMSVSVLKDRRYFLVRSYGSGGAMLVETYANRERAEEAANEENRLAEKYGHPWRALVTERTGR